MQSVINTKERNQLSQGKFKLHEKGFRAEYRGVTEKGGVR
jgi:hypothetical protein